MKTALKIIGGLVLVVLLLIGSALGWASVDWPHSFPDTPTPDIQASDDPEVIDRGEYVFHHVAHCTACHTPKERLLALEPGEHAVASGGFEWNLGPIGVLRSANITSHPETGIGDWTDEEIARTIRHGVRRDDRPAMMMVLAGHMSEEDLRAVVSYTRTLEPVENDVPPSDITALGKFVAKTAMPILAKPRPAKMEPPEHVPAGNTPSVERGEYLARGPAMCVYCHTKLNMETAELTSQPFSGGPAEPDPANPEMEIAAPNLTNGGRLSDWSEDEFVERIRSGRAVKGSSMPWENFQGMTESDVRSIYRYLETVEPSDNDPGPSYREAGWEPDQG